MDGKMFPAVGSLGERKVHTIKGSSKAWPVGLALRDGLEKDFQRVLLCEGSGDLVAAYHFCLRLSSPSPRFLPIAILGAGCKGGREILPKLVNGRFVRIVPHQDENGAGLRAACDWAQWLSSEGVHGDTFALSRLRRRDGSRVKDLNDCTDIHPEDASAMEELLK
jgi:hypothetical protein